ncbi:MAG: hypothetical protein HYU73_09525 [Betaproteobacteria bacterium]|nr:hypothetical protein [Betaproteobacteria bacterium]
MNKPGPSLYLPKPQLSDEAAVELLDFLYELTTAFENAYSDQLHRYYASFDHSAHQQPPTEPLDPSHDSF